MEGLKIVEYTPVYAKAIAEMWQKSTEGWNGENGNETEETVLADHVNSTDINTYLAILGDEVLGYCAFSKYVKDEGALHIRRLNARYDCHGKGIGKALVKKSVERTIELNWPRLDIYTWPANTKAIPLYKRCGYFLENRQDTIHLMNFIPTVVNTEAVKDYFKDVDWYDDMKRKINIEPDGRGENGFDFYEYCWDKDGKNLRMEFERRGRGLRLIETDDYMISLSVASQNLILGRSYKATYEIINKTGNQLNIEIIGRDDKNIQFSLNKKIQVVEKEIVEGEFYLSEIQEEFGNFKTHPAVVAEVVINGKKALFKLGIVPKFPAKILLACDDVERCSGETFNMYIDIESCINENGVFEFELPRCRDIEFAKRLFKIKMTKKQKVSIPLECKLKNPCIYQEEINVKVALESGESIQFKKDAAVIFRGRNTAFGGEVEGKYVIVNGVYKLTLEKNYNRVEIFVGEKKKSTYIVYPKLGMPYSDEFGSILVKNIEWYFENEKMVLSGEYVSNEFRNITVKTIFKISNNGIFEHLYEIMNNSNEETKDDIYIDNSFHYRIEGAYIPYDNKVVQATEPRMEYPGYYDSGKISENWIFSSVEESIIWPKNLKCEFDGWLMHIEYPMGKLKGREKILTEPVYLAFSTFKNIDEVRRFALKSNNVNHISLAEDFQIDVNNKNPFVKEYFDINIIENRKLLYNGEIIVKSKNNSFDEVHAKVQDDVNNITVPIYTKKGLENDLICIQSNFSSVSFERKASVFYIKNMEFKSKVTQESGLKVYSISNGVMNIKASPKFSTGIFSIKFMDREWLDNSFPSAGPRSWYNPWFGGIQNVPEKLVENGRSILNEKVKVEFVEKIDTLGNMWSGIKTSMCMEHMEDYKGLEINQYFLMLPGVPIILNTTELVNGMDKYISSERIMNIAFFKIGDEIKNSWVSVKNHQGDINKYKVGTRDYEINTSSSPLYGCDSLEYKLQVNTDFNGSDHLAYLSTRDLVSMNGNDIHLASGERKILPNVFYTFTKEHISDKLIKNLQNIRFE
ncbi:MAG: GNAT family N-acetyltransferase [Clostridium sp.]|uniref:GNAT family N-acetyltransferase n=1 Tax=Clostridium sp. TaxID=1506 RepID=UPI0030414BF1